VIIVSDEFRKPSPHPSKIAVNNRARVHCDERTITNYAAKWSKTPTVLKTRRDITELSRYEYALGQIIQDTPVGNV
jgi:hypothetical protein